MTLQTPTTATKARSRTGSLTVVLAIAATLVALSAPVWASSYTLNVLIAFAVNATLVLGYRTVTAMGGWSFAHVATMGLGAYTYTILISKGIAWPAELAIAAAACSAALFAAAIAIPVLRTRSFYFFLSTFAAGEALRQSFIQFPALTGGNNGIPFIARPQLLGISFQSDTAFYLLAAGVALGALVGLDWIDRSRFGRTLVAVRLNESLSESLGISTYGYRMSAFVLGSAIAGVAGALSAGFNGIINPSDFGPDVMFKVVAAAIIGGVSSLWGPLLGLAYLTFLEEVFRDFQAWVPLFWGVSVIAVLLFSPPGLEGLATRITNAFRRGRTGR